MPRRLVTIQTTCLRRYSVTRALGPSSSTTSPETDGQNRAADLVLPLSYALGAVKGMAASWPMDRPWRECFAYRLCGLDSARRMQTLALREGKNERGRRANLSTGPDAVRRDSDLSGRGISHPE